MSEAEMIKSLEARVTRAENKADAAAEIALGSVETIKHFQTALEHGHAKESEVLAATRKMVNIVESLARQVLKNAPTGT